MGIVNNIFGDLRHDRFSNAPDMILYKSKFKFDYAQLDSL